MIRIATEDDANQLDLLNNEFNGQGNTSKDCIRDSILNNKQEVVIVAQEDESLVGFVCVQLKKSFCYDDFMPEITEVYVRLEYRKKGIASAMIAYAERYCNEHYALHKYEILTGKNNITAQSVYKKLGYEDDNEIHLSKRREQ